MLEVVQKEEWGWVRNGAWRGENKSGTGTQALGSAYRMPTPRRGGPPRHKRSRLAAARIEYVGVGQLEKSMKRAPRGGLMPRDSRDSREPSLALLATGLMRLKK